MSKPNRIAVHANDTKDLARRLYDEARASKLPTWRLDEKKGTRFTHTASSEQWEEKAWLAMAFDSRDQRVIHFKLQPPDGKTHYEKERRGGCLSRSLRRDARQPVRRGNLAYRNRSGVGVPRRMGGSTVRILEARTGHHVVEASP